MSPALSNALKTLSQVLAIICLAFLFGMIAHKWHTDISALAEKHSGQQFWVALGRYAINNLAGAGSPAPGTPSDR
jgi:hypothetical protein